MTYVGAPMVYYGDEVGMWGGNDPDCRKPMVWEDIEYEDETHNANGSTHDPDKVEINIHLLEHYKSLIHIRKENICLQKGTYSTIMADDDRDMLVFERSYKSEKLIIVINNSNKEQSLAISKLGGGCFIDILKNNIFKSDEPIIVDKKWGLILKSCI